MDSINTSEKKLNLYNKAFFGLWENIFVELKNQYGKEVAIEFAKKIMKKSLSNAYNATGFKKGIPKEFERVLKLRDNDVGLLVDFPKVSESEIIYVFRTDPFPNLKSEFTLEEIFSTFIPFKIEHILGSNWNYKITKNNWKNDSYTEINIYKAK